MSSIQFTFSEYRVTPIEPIEETTSLSNQLDQLQPGDLGLLDIDDATIWSTHDLNSEQCRHFFLASIQRLIREEKIPEYDEGKNIANEEVMLSLINTALNFRVPVELVDQDLAKAIKDAQERRVHVIGYTGRIESQKEETHLQLKSVGIKLEYIIFVGRSPTGKGDNLPGVLERFPEAKKVILMDDGIGHLKAFISKMESIAKEKIYRGYLFTSPAKRRENFKNSTTDASDAVLQLEQLLETKKLISKAEAHHLMKTRNNFNHEQLLDHLIMKIYENQTVFDDIETIYV